MSSKDKILKKVREALKKSNPVPYPQEKDGNNIYPPPADELAVVFAKELGAVGGKFVYCANDLELAEQLEGLSEQKGWRHLYCWEKDLQERLTTQDFRLMRIGKILDKADVGITSCEALVARLGSVLLSSRQASGRTLSVYPPIHIVVASFDDLVYDIQEAFQKVIDKYQSMPSMMCLAAGPSRTADIEKTLVLGAHGPKEIYVFLVDNEEADTNDQ